MKFLLILSMLGLLSACSTVVTKDYKEYVANNQGQTYPTVPYAVNYEVTPATKNHSYKFSSAMAGWGNSWVVKFDDILDSTLKSRDMQSSFKGLTEGTEGPRKVVFNLVNYKFADHHATVELQVTAIKDGKTILEKTYTAHGISQGGKMFWGGGMAMKNAVQQSSKDAVDKIMRDFMTDLKTKI